MPPKSKTEKLRDQTYKELNAIKKQLDPRTYAAYDRDIYKAVGPSALYKLIGKFESIKEMQEKAPTKTAKAKQTNIKNKENNKRVLEELNPLKKFFVKGDVSLKIYYKSTIKERNNKNGRTIGEHYEYIY